MADKRFCGACGSVLTAAGLCPRCLVRLGMEDDEPDETLTTAPLASEADLGDIGPYRLLSVLGEGGMGIVYLAEQRQPLRRRVALKLLRRGMESRDVIARFESERQALALMSHPNIARVLDAGTTASGLPFFVMEYVAGTPLTEYCDRNRLQPRQRLELFAAVCHAVQHAHQKGIIHRDIKPSNVLVAVEADRPVPKVIDFGVAKAINQRLTEKTLFTEHGVLVGTPGYISPEQAEMGGLDVDTRTDIYSLGVLLYELMAGVLPFDAQRLRRGGYREMQRIILEEEPLRPSTRVGALGATASEVAQRRRTDPRTLCRQLRGDLDWITLKALEKDRGRRYQSATELALDVERHLAGEPVAAGPPGAAYRLGKLVRRHRLLFGAASAVSAAVLAGAVVSSVQYVKAEEARRDARRQLLRLHVTTGMRLVDEGDPSGALPWLVGALKLEDGAPRQVEIQRLRIGAVLAQCPRLAGFWRASQSRAAFSPDGRSVAVGGQGMAVRIWTVDTGEPLTPPVAQPTTKMLLALRFSPDGRYLAAGGEDGTARIWDAATGGPLSAPLRHQGAVRALAFSPEGQRLATAGRDGTVRLWHVPDGRPLFVARHPEPDLVAFARGGRALVSAGRDGTVRAWDAASGRALFPPIRHGNTVNAIDVSPDGERVASASLDYTARVWSLKDGSPLTPPLPHTNNVVGVRFSPDGEWVATAAFDKTAGVWNARTGQPRYPALPHGNLVIDAAFSPDGRLLATAAMGGLVTLWDVARGVRAGPQLRTRADTLEFDRSGRLLLAVRDTVALWDLAGAEPESPPLPHTQRLTGVEASPDGHRIVTYGGPYGKDAGGYAQVWDADTSEPVTPPLRHAGYVDPATFSPDGATVLTAGAEGTAQVWSAADGEPVTPPLRHPGPLDAAHFSLDGRRILTAEGEQVAGAAGAIRVWDAASGAPLTDPMRQLGVIDAVFSPDGSRIAVGTHEGAQVIDARSGASASPPLPHRSGVGNLAFTPDGRYLAGGGFDGVATVWDPGTGTAVVDSVRHAEWCHVGFDRTGRRLVTYSNDGTARLWDARTGAPLIPPLEHQALVGDAEVSADGALVLTSSMDRTARIWDTASGAPVSPGFRHRDGVWRAVFLAGRRIATASRDRTARIWELPLDETPVPALEALATLLAARKLQPGGAEVPVAADELLQSWTLLRRERPQLFAVSAAKVAAWHRRQADELVEERRWPEALAHLDAVLASAPARWRDRTTRGRVYAELGRWAQAADDFAKAFELRADDPETAHAHAVTELAAGNRAEYRRTRAWLLHTYGGTRNPDRAGWLARTAILEPADDAGAAGRAVTLARTALEVRPDQPDLLELVAAALVRAGRRDEAASLLQSATRARAAAKPMPPAERDWRDQLEARLRREAGL